MNEEPEIVARDDMYTVTRRPPPPGATTAEQLKYLASHTSSELPFDDWLREYLAFIDGWLARLDRPPASGELWIVGGRWRNLSDVPKEQRTQGRAVWGSVYLLETEKELTLAWWLATLAYEARLTLGAQTADHKMHRVLALGELRERFKSHRLYRDAVALGRRTKADRSAGGKATRKTAPAPVKAEAAETRKRHPTWSERRVAEAVGAKLGVPLGTVRRILDSRTNKAAHR